MISVINSSVKRFYPFLSNRFIPPFGEIVVITQIGKTLIDLTNLVKSIIVLLSVRFLLLHLYSVFNEHNSLSTFLSTGGLKWTRTTDLALIRRAL